MQRYKYFRLFWVWITQAGTLPFVTAHTAATSDYICAPGNPGAQLPFCNTSLSFEQRAADVAQRIPIDEAGALLSTSSAGFASLGESLVSVNKFISEYKICRVKDYTNSSANINFIHVVFSNLQHILLFCVLLKL